MYINVEHFFLISPFTVKTSFYTRAPDTVVVVCIRRRHNAGARKRETGQITAAPAVRSRRTCTS